MRTRQEASVVTAEAVAKMIDQAVLTPDHTFLDVEQACSDAVQQGFASVCLAPYAVSYASKLLRGTGVAICGTVGIPLGHSGLTAKAKEAWTSIEAGANEIEMVINLMAMKSGRYGDVQTEIAALRKLTTGLVLRVTLECCYLTDPEKARACQLAVEAGADSIKTNTGFGSGGVTRFKQVLDLLRVGATRIGTSNAMGIIKDFYKWEPVN